MVLPIVAAGAAVGGQLINSSGQNSALKAVERAYAAARERQQGFDQQSFEATRDMIDGISPDSLVPVAVQNEMTQRGAADTANITRAVGTQAARRGGGRNAESLAVMNQNMPGVQMRANEEGALAALMAAWNQGGYDLTRGRRELDMERQRLSADATAWQAMLPVDLRHAQKKGQASRQLGTLLSLFGQYGINSAMAQPKERGHD